MPKNVNRILLKHGTRGHGHLTIARSNDSMAPAAQTPKATASPAPWTLQSYGWASQPALVAANGRLVCRLEGMDLERNAECAANAALLEAAPELLDALRDLLGPDPALPTAAPRSPAEAERVRAKARAAIAKATRQQP